MNSPARRPGRIEEISSAANPRIKAIKALALKKNRDRDRIFLTEGRKLVADALDQGWHVKTLLYSRQHPQDTAQTTSIQSLAVRIRARGGDVMITTDKLLTSITRRDNPQSAVAVVEQQLVPLSMVCAESDGCWLALDRVRDPGNLGTIVRTADALGANGVILVGDSTDPFSLEAVRATMGSLFHVPLVRTDQTGFLEFSQRWRAQGGVIIGTHLEGSVDHRSVDYSAGPQLLLMGNEQQGLPDTLVQGCDQVVRVAMAGAADSLNLAVATGIVLYEARRHRLPVIGNHT